VALALADIRNITLQALQYEVLDGGEVLLRIDEVLFLINKGVHVVDEENEQHLAMVLSLKGL
jgi:hypothetical protein